MKMCFVHGNKLKMKLLEWNLIDYVSIPVFETLENIGFFFRNQGGSFKNGIKTNTINVEIFQ